MRRSTRSTLSALVALSAATAQGGGGHHKKVYVQAAQAPVVYAAQAPTLYAAQAPTVVNYVQQPAQAPVVYNMVAQQAPVAGQSPSVGNAPGDEECTLEPEERRDVVEELRAVKADAVKDKSTLADRRAAVRSRAGELVADICGKDADDPGVKKLVRSLVAEVMSGSAPTMNASTKAPGAGYGYGYGQPQAYPVPVAYAAPIAYAPAPFVLIPIGPIGYAPQPKHCIHNLLHPCARCRGY